jgi:hypothetical protein
VRRRASCELATSSAETARAGRVPATKGVVGVHVATCGRNSGIYVRMKAGTKYRDCLDAA